MELTRYEHTAAPQLAQLLDGERQTFSVMRNIVMGAFGPAAKIVTDHSRLMLCYTCPPFPGWVWLPKDASSREMEAAWALIQRELPPDEGFCVNVRDSFAAYIAQASGGLVRVQRRLAAYECVELAAPVCGAQGDIYAVSAQLLDLAAAWSEALSREENLDLRPLAVHRQEMAAFIGRKRLFMWKTPDGTPVAMCTVSEDEGLGYIGQVYTPMEHRRHGYAAALMHGITRILLRQGKRPALYVSVDNVPAIRCYEKLGYRALGGICTMGL